MSNGYWSCDCDKYNPDCRCHPKERPMTTPDPEPVTAGDEDASKWEEVGRAVWHALEHMPRPNDAHGVSIYEHAGRFAVARAISLGLAVSPDDPRLQPLVSDHATVIAYFRGYASIKNNEEIARVYAGVAAVVAHLNERSAQ